MNHDVPDGDFRAIVFEDELIHKDVARCHRAGNLAVISAGFCNLDGSVYGNSDSLRMNSRPEDAIAVKRLFGLLQS